MYFTTMTFRNVMRRPLRSALTLTAVALAVCAVVSLVGIATGFKDTFMDFYQGVDVDLLVVRSGSARRLTSTLDEGLGDRIQQIEGVKEVIPGLADVVSFSDVGLYVVPVSGLVPETRVFESMKPISGRRLLASDDRGVMIGVTLADSLGKKTGDLLDVVEGEPYRVIGVYDSFNVIQNGSLVISLAELQRLMGREGEVSGFSIVTTDPGDLDMIDRVADQVSELETEITVRPTREHVESLSEIQLAIAMAWLTSTVATVIGAVGVLNTMFMSIQERTLEIGLLRAIGWSRWRIIAMILLEAILLAILGAAIGVLVSLVLVALLTRMPAVNGLIEGHISWLVVGQGFAIAIIVGLVGGLLPAIRASKLSPAEALRH
jgi:putative ABC transport system permease protein